MSQELSSDPSLQSGVPSQKSSLRTHTTEDCAPHASSPPLQSSSEELALLQFSGRSCQQTASSCSFASQRQKQDQ